MNISLCLGVFVAKRFKHNGFSLTEVLMAVGILSVGMMLIATMFPVGIYLTTIASERTMAAIVSDEAFAKIQLYGIVPHLDSANSIDYENELVSANRIDPNEFSYPPVDPCATNRQYYWSALYKFDPNSAGYLITVFIARKTNPNLTYPYSLDPNRPGPIKVQVVVPTKGSDELTIQNASEVRYVNPPTIIFDNATGELYRVVDRQDNKVKLNIGWEKDPLAQDYIWFIPPPDTGGKNADIEVFQRIITF
jgi:prepilin-type N-terminal cleavage/methylation domain-containing protein